jgi:glycosyltransferase involved in cell wall biosynthesis
VKRAAVVDLTFNWPPIGGSWVDVKEVCARLPKHGYQVHLFVPRFQSFYPRGSITSPLPFPATVIPFNRFTFNAVTVCRRIRRAVQAYAPDVVLLTDGYQLKVNLLEALRPLPAVVRIYSYEIVCLNLHYYLYGEKRICDGNFLTDPDRCHRCWFPGRSFQKRLVGMFTGFPEKYTRFHFSHEYVMSGAFTQKYRRRLLDRLRQARAIVVYNEAIGRLFGPVGGEVRVIPGGVDTAKFSPRVGERRPGPVRILMTGRAEDPLKGYETLLEAARNLRHRGLEFEILVTQIGELPADAESFVKVVGWRSADEMPDLYRQADIVVVPSIWLEPFGMTVVEGMASGLPVVGSRIGGIARSIVDNETGTLVPPHEPQALADALEALIRDKDRRERMGRKGRGRAVEEFDWDVIVSRYYAPLFEEVLRGDFEKKEKPATFRNEGSSLNG